MGKVAGFRQNARSASHFISLSYVVATAATLATPSQNLLAPRLEIAEVAFDMTKLLFAVVAHSRWLSSARGFRL